MSHDDPAGRDRPGEDPLTQPDPTGTVLLLETDRDGLAAAAYRWRTAGRQVRVVRGTKCATYDRLMDEVGAALQLPLYFGENWPALAECLQDLDWVDPAAGLVVVVSDADRLLADEPVELAPLLRALTGAVRSWAAPVEQGEWWDRPAVAVRVVLQHPPGTDVAGRVEAAGAAVRSLSAT